MSQYLVLSVNFAGLMALTAIAFCVVMRSTASGVVRQVFFGSILGFGAIIASLQPIMFINGLQIDPRNLLVGCAGAFGGPLAAAISFVVAAATRYYEGDPTANVCVLSLFLAACAGLAWRNFIHNREIIDQKQLLLLGPVISLSYVCTFLLPREDWQRVVSDALPILITINIIGTMVLGGVLERERRRETREKKAAQPGLRGPADRAPEPKGVRGCLCGLGFGGSRLRRNRLPAGRSRSLQEGQ